MTQEKNIPENIDAYIAGFPDDIQAKLNEIRTIIRTAAPEAGEKISWGMPTFTLKGKILVQFAAHKAHIGYYPMPETIEAFEAKLTSYKTSKGGIQFPYKDPLPAELIAETVKFRTADLADKLKK